MNYSTEVKQKLLSIITKMDSYYWLFTKHPKTDFSRKKKWSFEEVMKFMLTMEGKALRDELLEYFEFDNTTPSQKITIFDRNQLWFLIKTLITTELKFKHNTESQTIKIINELNKGLIEREAQFKLGLLAIVSGENILFIGPPGTAKSKIGRRLSHILKNSSYFEYLLTKFTTPEEIFGPISLKELENDKFHRNTKGYLTDSNVVFLDEIFKANSAILNSLLTILNEKIYHNGYIKENVDTQLIIGASNEDRKSVV